MKVNSITMEMHVATGQRRKQEKICLDLKNSKLIRGSSSTIFLKEKVSKLMKVQSNIDYTGTLKKEPGKIYQGEFKSGEFHGKQTIYTLW